MQPADVVLLAAKFDFDTIVPIVIAIIVIVSQVVNAFRQAAKGPPPIVGQQRPPQGRLAPPQQGQGRPPELDSEIENLLRRALRGEPPRPPQPPQRPPKQQQQKQKTKKTSAEVQAQRTAEVARRPSGGDITRHVEEAFAQDLAHASPSGTARKAETVVASSQIGDLIAALRSPEDLRRLIVVREILEIPTHRW